MKQNETHMIPQKMESCKTWYDQAIHTTQRHVEKQHNQHQNINEGCMFVVLVGTPQSIQNRMPKLKQGQSES